MTTVQRRLVLALAIAVVACLVAAQNEDATWDDRPTMLGNFANIPQVWYGLVKLHALEQLRTSDLGLHIVTMLPKLAKDKSPLQALERFSGRSKARDALFKYEFEQLATGDPDTRVYDDALAEAEAADDWAQFLDETSAGARHLHRPRLMFNVSAGIISSVTVVADNDHLQPFTLLIAHSESGEVVLNATSIEHSLGAAAVRFPMRFVQCGMCVDQNIDFEILLHFHARRMTTFEAQFQVHDLPTDGSPKVLVPWNGTLGVKFVVQLKDGSLGVWVSRRPPIPDFALEIFALDTQKSRLPEDATRVVASVFSRVEPGGMGLSDVLRENEPLMQRDDVIFTAMVHFAERPRSHYARFVIEDMFGLVSRARRRPAGDGEVLLPTVVDHVTMNAKTEVLPVRLFIRWQSDADYLSVELLQPRPIENVQLWVRDANHKTIFLEEERHVDHVEHWRRDVPLFGWHHVIPITRPHPQNMIQLDVLFDNATATDVASQVLEWAHDHGADVSRVRIQRAKVGTSVDYPAAITGGDVLVTQVDVLANHRILELPPSLLLFSAHAHAVPWIRDLLESQAFLDFANNTEGDEPDVEHFFSGDTDQMEVLKVTLLVLAWSDPPNQYDVRFQRLYRSIRDVALWSSWQTPLLLFNESVALLNRSAPHFVEAYLTSEYRAWTAMHEFISHKLSWLMRDALRHGWDAQLRGPSSLGGGRGWPLPDFLRVVAAVRQSLIPGHSDADPDTWLAHPAIAPIVNYAPRSEAPNAEVVRAENGGLQLVAKTDLKRDDVIFVDTFSNALTTFESLMIFGHVANDAIGVLDFSNGVLLRADDKASREPLMARLCGDDIDGPARFLQCLRRLERALIERGNELPLVIDRPPQGSRLYERNARIVLAATRCLVGARKAQQMHLAWARHDIATWQLLVPEAERLGDL